MMAELTDSDIEQLIVFWEEEEDLWNLSREGYHKKDTRSRALTRIQDKLKAETQKEFTVSQINSKIQNLRCYYGRELKKAKGSKKSGAGTSEIYTSKWPFFPTLDAFLRDQIVPRKSISTLDNGSDDSDDNSSNLSFETPAPKKRKRNQASKADDVMDRAVSVLSSLQNNQSERQKEQKDSEDDEELIYAKHISNEIKKINDARTKALTKLKIQQIIFDAQFQGSNIQNQQIQMSSPSNSNPLSQMTTLMSTHLEQI